MKKPTSDTRNLGQRGETLAEAYLIEHGYQPLEKNWRAGALGEVDLIMVSPDATPTVVFIEVKTRRNRCSQTALELALSAISPTKQRQLQHMAEHYLHQHPHYSRHPWQCRMDVVAVGLAPSTSSDLPCIHHIHNALS